MKSEDQNSVAIWTCRGCEVDALISLVDLERIAGIPESPNRFVDFVCPRCGHGDRRSLDNIPHQSLQIPYLQNFMHVALRCDKGDCGAYASVHTLATDECKTSPSKSDVRCWQLEGITCSFGHPTKRPPEVLSSVLD
jgi:hypothetical protein